MTWLMQASTTVYWNEFAYFHVYNISDVIDAHETTQGLNQIVSEHNDQPDEVNGCIVGFG